MIVANRELELGENDEQWVLRPSWTSEKNTGMFESYKHRHGMFFRCEFYVRSQGLDQIPRKNAE